MKTRLVALRRLARRPSFAVPAIATLAVGVGATTAIFSTVNAALLRPLPYPQAEDLYVLQSARVDGGWSNGFVSYAELGAIASGAPSVIEVAGMMGDGTDVWEIFAPAPTSDAELYNGFVRVRPGASPDEVRSELAGVMGRRVQDGVEAEGRGFTVTPLVESIVGDLGPILWIVLAAATVLMTLGCANVAALILARGGSQTREFAIRKALGASRGAVVRQMLTESLLLSAFGTGIGVLLAAGGVRALSALGANGLPRLDRVTFDMNVLFVAASAMVATTLLVGVLPMVRLVGLDVRSLLGGSGRSVTGERGARHLLSGIVVTEIALAIVLVTSAGWLVRSYANLTETDPGFAPASRLMFQANLIGSSYVPIERVVHSDDGIYLVDDRTGDTPETWMRDLLVQLEGLEGFRALGMGSVVPFRSQMAGMQYVSVPGTEYDPSAPDLTRFRFVTPDFFEAMGMPLLAGRALTDADPRTTVVVNEAFARAYLADRDPVGVTFGVGFEPGEFRSERTIAGVVSDVRYTTLREPDTPSFYSVLYNGNGFVVVSTSLDDPTLLIPAVRDAVRALDPGVPVTIESFDQIMSIELARHRLGLLLMSLFAAASLLLTAIGIHGVIGHGTSLRSTEFAVRIAVGARPATIVRSVLKQGGTLWLIGVPAGVALAYLAGRLGSARLYEVRAADPMILAAAVSAVSALALAAIAVSAVRGSRVDLGTVLKAD